MTRFLQLLRCFATCFFKICAARQASFPIAKKVVVLYNCFMKNTKENKKEKRISKVKGKSSVRLGVALSGGGTRGFAHVGALRALVENGVDVYCVAGTSVGSLFGAAFALGKTVDEIERFCLTVKDKDVTGSRLLKFGYPPESVATLADKLFGGATFADLKLPFACVAVDIEKGEEVILDEGRLAEACSASCAVPVIFKPVKKNGSTLVDGGLKNNVPADVCRMLGADVVVSVDLNVTRGEGTSSDRVLDQLAATWRIMTASTAQKGYYNSDVLICPELRKFRNTTTKGAKEMIAEGYRAAMEKMDEIKRLLYEKGV